MTIREFLTPLLALSLTVAPVAAQARKAAPMQDSEAIAGKAWIPWAIALAVIAVVVVLVAHDNMPKSP